MDFEFDKEIDALLRQSARESEAAFAATNPQSPHLDADGISAFAENALPEKIRAAYTTHLSDCDRCRKILSNIIALNNESESKTAHAAQEPKQIAASPIPWYRKLVAFPNLAYMLGALILVFSGIALFTVLQNVNDSKSPEVSQVSERQPNGKGMSSDGSETAVESSSSNMTANSASANSAAMSFNSNRSTVASNSAMPSAPVITSANSNMTIMRDEADKNLKAEPKTIEQQNKPVDLPKTEDSIAAGAPPPAKENKLADGEASKQQSNTAQNSTAQNQGSIQPDLRRVQSAPSATMRAETKSKKVEDAKDDALEKSNESTTVGGKTFKRAGNVWIDSAYRGQATTNITRGTKEYKKLDSGLREIVENLGGTVVIVWKERAYRIQ